MDLEKTVRTAFVLREPAPDFEDVVMARVSAAAWRASQTPPRRRRHLLLFGVMFFVAAAAAMGVVLRGELVPRVIAQTVVSESAAMKTVPAAAGARNQETASAPPAEFRVHLSLQHDSTDAVVMGKVREYHAALADGLRAVPGLQLIDDEAATKAVPPADFRVTIDKPDALAAKQMLARGEWAATLKVEVLKAGGYVPAQGMTRGGAYGPGSMAEQATGGPLSGNGCHPLILCSPAAIAAWQVKDLRMAVFPFEPSLQRDLEAQFLDSTRPFHERIAALNDLHDLGAKPRKPMSTPVLHAVLQLIANERDPGERSTLWYFISGQHDPELLQPLIAAAQQESDDAARLGVVSQLAADFKSDPAARTALQSIARRDAVLLNRKVAERAVAGDVPWIDYVVATAKDTTQSVQQRLAPLGWMVTYEIPMSSLGGVLFGRDRQEFIDLFARASREWRGQVPAQILRSVGSMKQPESSGFLLAVFEASPGPAYLGPLAEHMDDPQVRKRVEELAADSTIPALQAAAAEMLREQPGN